LTDGSDKGCKNLMRKVYPRRGGEVCFRRIPSLDDDGDLMIGVDSHRLGRIRPPGREDIDIHRTIGPSIRVCR